MEGRSGLTVWETIMWPQQKGPVEAGGQLIYRETKWTQLHFSPITLSHVTNSLELNPNSIGFLLSMQKVEQDGQRSLGCILGIYCLDGVFFLGKKGNQDLKESER